MDNDDSTRAQEEEDKPTKRQLKRLVKAERAQVIRKQKKVEKKEAKKLRVQETEGEEGDRVEPFPPLPFEPLNPVRLERKQGLMQSTALAALNSPRIVIDIDGFEDLMTLQEKSSMVSQVSYSYAANKSAPIPVKLHITGHSPFVLERLAKMGSEHWKEWNAELDQRPVQEVFPDKSQLVYLSADSEHEITELDPTKVYVIGGIVDRNRHKGLCHKRAEELGLATGRFSLHKHHPNSGARVLTTNHCVDILLEFLSCKQWPQAFQKCIPVRKHKPAEHLRKEGEEEEEEEEVAAVVEEEQVTAPKTRKRAVILGADHGVGLALAPILYEEGWHLVLLGKDRAILDDLATNKLCSNKGIAVTAVANSLVDGDSARMKEIVFTRFLDRKMDLLVLNESSLDAGENFTAKACGMRELKRFYNPKQGNSPQTIVVNPIQLAEKKGQEYDAWCNELKSRLPIGVFELSSDEATPLVRMTELVQWIEHRQV
ncbi:hypothetical protein BASA81_001837 [Batrachochytrium salamandrivorans]|nr:hypothetical protein BASA81_001837 [Batrachochytrium salamandrivorans]